MHLRFPDSLRSRFGRWGLLLLGACSAAQALDPERAIRQLPHVWYEERLPQNTVLSIAQRSDGSMWFATYGGLVRYSGAEFEVIDRRAAPALRSSAITALHEGRGGVLWIGTLNGGLYRADGSTITAVQLPATIESVFGLVEDRAGDLWMTTNAGVARHGAHGTQLFGRDSGFPRGPYRGLIADAAGGVWIAADGTGVAHWQEGRVEVLGPDRGLPSPAVYSIAFDRAGTLWAGTQEGLARWLEGRFEREPRAAELDAKRVYAVLGDRDGSLWVTAQGMGICRLTRARFDCQRAARGLSNDIVRSMFEDREGSLWLGTTNSAVHRISDSKLITVVGRLDSNSIRAVYEDARGTVWVGTDGAGLTRYEDQQLVPSAANAQLLSPFTRSVTGDARGNLWVGTIEGLNRIAPDGSVRSYRVADGLPGGIVFSLLPADDGVWVATSVGLAKVREDRVEPVPEATGIDVRALHQDAEGRLWLGLRSGLRCWHRGVLDRCGGDGLPSISVFAFHAEPDGSFWLGTSQGLARWDLGQARIYGRDTGLYGDAVFSILADREGHFWLSSNRGIAKIARQDLDAFDRGELAQLSPQWFDKRDGMLSSQASGASGPPAWRARDGRLWIGTSKGVVLIDPERLRRNTQPPPVVIERMRVDGVDHDPSLAQTIGPGVDRLEFQFAGMSFVAPEAVRYRYRLEGYDRSWIDAGTARLASYTNLPPGAYEFRAIAANNDGVWNEAGAGIAFSIAPRLHETLWFRLLAGAALLALLIGAYRLRLWQLRVQERALREEVAARTEDLRAANAELRRFASMDGLTRIGNRGAFDQALTRQWYEHRRRGASLALLLGDIDAFKAYNDSYGHQAGDAALIRVAATLTTLLRDEADLAARYGGEELALLLSDCEAEEAMIVAQRWHGAVRALAIEHRASMVATQITMSIGVVALVPGPQQSPEEMVRLADEALYQAKAEGRDRVRAARPQDAPASV